MLKNKKKLIVSFSIIFLLALSLYFLFNNEKMIVSIGGREFLVEIAIKERDLIKGLSGRHYMDADKGMIFIFEEPEKYGFWMKDMNFPLDVIWISSENKIVHIESSLATSTYPRIFYPKADANYVLEINSGEVEKSNIKIGDIVKFVKK